MNDLIIFIKTIDPQFYTCIFGLVIAGIGIYNPLLLGLYSPENTYNESPVMILIFRLLSGMFFLVIVLYLLYRLVTGTWFGN